MCFVSLYKFLRPLPARGLALQVRDQAVLYQPVQELPLPPLQDGGFAPQVRGHDVLFQPVGELEPPPNFCSADEGTRCDQSSSSRSSVTSPVEVILFKTSNQVGSVSSVSCSSNANFSCSLPEIGTFCN